MGKFSIHIKHYKAQQLAGIDRHNRRLGKNHSNKSIDGEKSRDNLTLRPVSESLYRDTKKRIQEEVIDKGHRVTKASVWITEICCTLPEGIEKNDSERYFGEIVKYFERALGERNIISAYVHMDETKPHLHLCVVPITEEGRLSRKEVWTRKRLLALHDEIPKCLQNKGFNVERGDHLADFEDKKKAALSLKEYKAFQEREKLKQEYNGLVREYNELADKYNHVAKERVALKRGNLRIAQSVIAREREICR